MAGCSSLTNAIKPVMSTWKGAKSGILAGGAIGGGAGALYGGISDNHTALGMGLVGAGLGAGLGREYKGLKAWQGAMNKRIAANNVNRVAAGKTAKAEFDGLDRAWQYGKYRAKSFFG